jgi:ATP-dependent Clp protease ATP-binding subunit ClpX
LPVVATLDELDEAALVQILVEPKNSLVRQYQTIFGFEDVKLDFTEGALKAIASEAIKRNVGARGLRIILEELMLDLMYSIPSRDDLKELVIDEDAIRTNSTATLLKKAG